MAGSLVAVAPDPGGSTRRRRVPSREQTMNIPKTVIIAVPREPGQNDRADVVDRELPDFIKTSRHGGLLATLHVDPAAAEPA